MLELLTALALCLPAAPPMTASPGDDSPPVADSVKAQPLELQRVVVIGASMSAGFGLRSELEANVNLADVLDVGLKRAGIEFLGLGSTFFFQDPRGMGAKQIQAALAFEPDLVVALDFPFWYAHGWGLGCDKRAAEFERCLRELEKLQCTVLVGDLPNMKPAAKGPNAYREGKALISHAQIPEPDCLQRMNTRLAAWADERPGVHVFPLSRFTAEQRSTDTLELRGNSYDAERKAGLMQADLLHPTYRGTIAAMIAACDVLVTRGVLAEEQVEFDAEQVEAGLWEATRALRAENERKRIERAARRKARKKKREREKSAEAGAAQAG